MALLLAMYQKMRLIREKNQLVLEQSQLSSKISRIQKNIKNVQERYTKMSSNAESMAKRMQSAASVWIRNSAGLGTSSVNLGNYYQQNSFSMNYAYQYLINNTTNALDPDRAQWLVANAGQLTANTGEDGSAAPEGEELKAPDGTTVSKEEYQLLQQAQQYGQMAYNQTQNQVQMFDQNYQNNVSIWLEARKAEIEAEQDAALAPLNEQDTLFELQKELNDSRLQRINAELESYKSLCSEEAKNMAPSFGLR